MAAAIGWYGPLIDLCKASSYIGDYVQLIVFVHKFTPIQYKISGNGGEVVRMDVLVGDETRSYFPVTIWQKQMRSQISAGHVFLLQNLKITRYGDTVEARALHCSSLRCLLQPDDFVSPKGLDILIGESRVGITVKDKLQKVAGWLQRAKLAHCGSVLNYDDCRKQLQVNWKLHEEICTQDCSSLSDLCQCEDSSKATFHASVGEIFLPITWERLGEPEAERMFISRRLHKLGGQNGLVDDLITTGCQLCGTPVKGGLGYGEVFDSLPSLLRFSIKPLLVLMSFVFGSSNAEQNTIPLYCQRSSDRLHVIGTIYRPFLLYVWDDSKYLPISVSNKAAELLFGNIPAEKVFSSYKKTRQPCSSHTGFKKDCSRATKEVGNSLSCTDRDKKGGDQNPNFYKIWLILLNALFQHGKNSPFKFKVTVDAHRDWENGRLEMVSMSLPAFTGMPSAQNRAQ